MDYKITDVEKSFEVTFVAATATQTVMQGEITESSKNGDIIDVEVEEIGVLPHEHPEIEDLEKSKVSVAAGQETLTIWRGTEAEYNLVADKDDNTLYVITG